MSRAALALLVGLVAFPGLAGEREPRVRGVTLEGLIQDAEGHPLEGIIILTACPVVKTQ